MPLRRRLAAAARSLMLAAALTAPLAACQPQPASGPPSAAATRAEQADSARLVQQLRRKGKIVEDRRAQAYLDGMLARVDRQRGRGLPPLRGFIVADAGVNAFTTGGGYVFVNAGMMAAMENEAQLAMVIAHEVAHVDRGHVSAGKRNRQSVGVLATLAALGGAALGAPEGLVRTGVGLGAQAAISSFTRDQEREADAIGARYHAAAGWNTLEGAKSFAVLQRLYGNGGGFLASHPASAERRGRLTAMARQLGAADGVVNAAGHKRATRRLSREVLEALEDSGREREAAQVRRNLL